MMKKHWMLFLLGLSVLGLLPGCFSTDPDADDTVPHNRPAMWENEGPNMPGVPGAPTY